MNKNSKSRNGFIHLYNPKKEGLGSYDVHYINAYKKDKNQKKFKTKGINELEKGLIKALLEKYKPKSPHNIETLNTKKLKRRVA